MRDYLNRLRMQFQRFMIGRYGMDQFGRFLSSLLLALIIFNFLIPAALLPGSCGHWNGSYSLSCMQECFLKTLISVTRKMKPF